MGSEKDCDRTALYLRLTGFGDRFALERLAEAAFDVFAVFFVGLFVVFFAACFGLAAFCDFVLVLDLPRSLLRAGLVFFIAVFLY